MVTIISEYNINIEYLYTVRYAKAIVLEVQNVLSLLFWCLTQCNVIVCRLVNLGFWTNNLSYFTETILTLPYLSYKVWN